GPNLWGVVGGPHAHKGDYSYSEAMKNAKGDWDYESLNKFIEKPTAAVPGTKMGFAGLKKAQDRADVIAWLRQQADSPIPPPDRDRAQGRYQPRDRGRPRCRAGDAGDPEGRAAAGRHRRRGIRQSS